MASVPAMFADLKRRGVFRVAGIYGVTAWAISEVAISVEEPLQLPGWIDTSIIVVLGLGFPIALIFAYAFNLTPDGIKPDRGAETSESASRAGSRIPNIVLSLALTAAVGYIAWQHFGSSGGLESDLNETVTVSSITDVSRPVPGYDGREAIAVLPFINMSGDPAQGYLADGIAEDIITELYTYKTFPVIARTSTFRYKGRSKDAREIAAELGAGYILEGSIRRIGDQVRITAQLIDAQGEHLWAENYDEPWSEFLNVQDEITYRMVEAIEPELIRSEMRRRRDVGTDDMVAWDYYLRARSLGGEEFSATTLSGVPVTNETNEEAWRLANKALEIAPNSATIYSLMSHIDGVRVLWLSKGMGRDAIGRIIERGLRNAARARGLDPFEATACACQVVLLLLKQDVAAAVEVGESALKENPGSSFILAGLAKAVQVSGDYPRALELIGKAKRLSPKGISMPTYLTFEAQIRQSMGDMEGARRVIRQATLLSSPRPDGEMIRITSLLAEGERELAIQAMHALRRDDPDYKLSGLWPEPFPQSVIDRVDEPMRSRLQGTGYVEGVEIVLRDLGWYAEG
jgi:TolB-like protein